jgi:hypothetical protein
MLHQILYPYLPKPLISLFTSKNPQFNIYQTDVYNISIKKYGEFHEVCKS